MRLTPTEQLATTLTTVSSFQEVIRQADTKASILLTIQGTLVALAGSAWPAGSGVWAVSIAVAFACSATVACVRFALALRPRTAGLPLANRFGFVSVATDPAAYGLLEVRRLQADAWQLAVLLAEIATAKHRHVRAGMPWLGASAVVAVVFASQWSTVLR